MKHELWCLKLASNNAERPWVFQGTPEWNMDGVWFQIWRSENRFYDYETNHIVANNSTRTIWIDRK
ncbi:hypothetical protein [Siphovirus Jomon_CT89]|nr:hypothetical protein [Siphovirus Jomon_CT89]